MLNVSEKVVLFEYVKNRKSTEEMNLATQNFRTGQFQRKFEFLQTYLTGFPDINRFTAHKRFGTTNSVETTLQVLQDVY